MGVVHYVNGAFVDEGEATVSALDLGILRGYGVFDYAPTYAGKPFHLEEHLKRLHYSASEVGLELPHTLDEIHRICAELLARNGEVDGGIRLVVTGGVSGEDLRADGEARLMILFQRRKPCPERWSREGMRVVTNRVLRLYPSIKTTTYLPAIQAMRSGADDALYVNEAGEILEATTSNIFFFQGQTLRTADEGILKGVTREIFLQLAEDEFVIDLRPVRVDELGACDEAFLTSSNKEAMPVVQIDDQVIGSGKPGPKAAHLLAKFRRYKDEYLSRAETTV